MCKLELRCFLILTWLKKSTRIRVRSTNRIKRRSCFFIIRRIVETSGIDPYSKYSKCYWIAQVLLLPSRYASIRLHFTLPGVANYVCLCQRLCYVYVTNRCTASYKPHHNTTPQLQFILSYHGATPLASPDFCLWVWLRLDEPGACFFDQVQKISSTFPIEDNVLVREHYQSRCFTFTLYAHHSWLLTNTAAFAPVGFLIRLPSLRAIRAFKFCRLTTTPTTTTELGWRRRAGLS